MFEKFQVHVEISLQAEFEYELSRLKTVTSSPTSDDPRLFTRGLRVKILFFGFKVLL